MEFIIYIDAEHLEETDPDVLLKIREEFNKQFYIGVADYLYKNNLLTKDECKKIKDKY